MGIHARRECERCNEDFQITDTHSTFEITNRGSMFIKSDATVAQTAICPDSLTVWHLGVADNWRGRVVRGFFQVMRLWRV